MSATVSTSMSANMSTSMSATTMPSQHFVRAQRRWQNGNPKKCNQPTNLLTYGVGARDTCVSRRGSFPYPRCYMHLWCRFFSNENQNANLISPVVALCTVPCINGRWKTALRFLHTIMAQLHLGHGAVLDIWHDLGHLAVDQPPSSSTGRGKKLRHEPVSLTRSNQKVQVLNSTTFLNHEW